MLKRERYEVQVGLVFVAALVFLIGGLLWAKRYRPMQSQMILTVVFPAVGGLSKGDEVLVSGIYMGQVTSLELRDREVLVEATLSRKVRLYEGYQVRVTTLTFTGEMGLTIMPGAGAPLPEPYPVLTGIPPLELKDVVEPSLKTLASVRAVADTLTWALPRVLHRTNTSLNHLDSILIELQEGVATNRVALSQTLTQLRTTLSSAGRLVSALDARLDTSLTAADRAFASLSAASDTLRHVLAALDTNEGTLGRMIHEPDLYNELRRATASLDSVATSIDSLAQDIRRNPRRYVRFSVF